MRSPSLYPPPPPLPDGEDQWGARDGEDRGAGRGGATGQGGAAGGMQRGWRGGGHDGAGRAMRRSGGAATERRSGEIVSERTYPSVSMIHARASGRSSSAIMKESMVVDRVGGRVAIARAAPARVSFGRVRNYRSSRSYQPTQLREHAGGVAAPSLPREVVWRGATPGLRRLGARRESSPRCAVPTGLCRDHGPYRSLLGGPSRPPVESEESSSALSRPNHR